MESRELLCARDRLLPECVSQPSDRFTLETGCLACATCVNLLLAKKDTEVKASEAMAHELQQENAGLRSEIDEKNIEIFELASLANTDNLTNLPNRNALQTKFSQYMEEATVSGKKFLLMMLDLDAFKSVNDERGYKRGDNFLEGIAGGLSEKLRREGDVLFSDLFRHGGDEFILMTWIPDSMDNQNRRGHKAEEFAERTGQYIQRSVLELDFVQSYNASSLTKNLGIKYGYSISEPGKNLEKMKNEADPKPPGSKADSNEMRAVDEQLLLSYQQLDARLARRRQHLQRIQY